MRVWKVLTKINPHKLVKWHQCHDFMEIMTLKKNGAYIETSCYLNISCQLSEKCLETFTSSSKTVLQRTEQERQSSYCSAQLQDSSVHCSGLLTAQALIQSTTRSGVCFRSECIEIAYTMSIIWSSVLWKSGVDLISASWTRQWKNGACDSRRVSRPTVDNLNIS